MQFIKKNYEKVLLGLVLIGLVVVAVFLLFLVNNEKDTLAQIRGNISTRQPRPLPEPDLNRVTALLRRVQFPLTLNYSDPTNKLFNPERWQKPPSGPLIKNPAGTEPERLELTGTPSLYLIFKLDTVSPAESGVRYGITVVQEAATKPALRRRSYYVTRGEKKEYGEKKETFTIIDVQGAPESPILVLELSDTSERPAISKEKEFRSVAGYMANLKYPPEKKDFPNRREGSTILVGGEEYIIVKILEKEVILQGKNQKKWTKKQNPAP